MPGPLGPGPPSWQIRRDQTPDQAGGQHRGSIGSDTMQGETPAERRERHRRAYADLSIDTRVAAALAEFNRDAMQLGGSGEVQPF